MNTTVRPYRKRGGIFKDSPSSQEEVPEGEGN